MLSDVRLRRVRSLAAAAALLLLSGCATFTVPTYAPAISNTEALEHHSGAALSVGNFEAATSVSNQSLSVRGNDMKAGGSSMTFAGYLHDALVAELTTAGRYDSSSPLTIDGELTHNEIKAGVGKQAGVALVAAHFTVRRAGKTVFDETLNAFQRWDSSFIGAIAIPAAVSNYPGAVQNLIAKLISDPAFIKATTPAASVTPGSAP